MSMRIYLAGLLAASLIVTANLSADDQAEKAAEFKATCPVSGQPAGEDHALTHRGKQVYFCCDNCPKAFAADPEKFTAATNFQLLQTGQIVQVACPFSGEAVDPATDVKFQGVAFGFCCTNCQAKFEKADAAEQLTLVFGDISKGFTLQNLCPVADKPIDVTKFVEHDGQKVYFCCGNCPKAFQADPDKFLSKLPQFAQEDKE